MWNSVQCKTCNRELAYGVKKCPNCGKDQRNWFMRHKILSIFGLITLIGVLLFYGLIFLVFFISSFSEDEEVASEAKSQHSITNNEEIEKNVSRIGDTILTNRLEISILKVEEHSVIGDPSLFGKKASDGGILVAIQYSMKNVSSEPIGMFSYPPLNLIDQNETEYSEDLAASTAYAVSTGIDNTKVFSDLNPDISVTGIKVFEVSKEKFAQGAWFIQVGDKNIQIK